MIGAIHFELRATNSAQLPFINGRFMHAAFFKIINEKSRAFGNFIHNELNIKPFTVSFLDPIQECPSVGDHWIVQRGEKFYWRITGLNDEILQAARNVVAGYEIQAGSLILTVEAVKVDSIIPVSELISDVKNFPPVKEMCFNFVSPVSFRIDKFDAPYPRAELIFSSLADKWTQANMPAEIEKKTIRDLAMQIRLTQWQGQSKKFYLAYDRGTTAFWGKFFYNLGSVNHEFQKIFLLLANFGEFSGVGRLTGQGFGQTRIEILT